MSPKHEPYGSVGGPIAWYRTGRLGALGVSVLFALLLPIQSAEAASIPRDPTPATPISHSDPLLKQQGGDASTESGDYVSNADSSSDNGNGLDSAYRYYIEVPPGTSRLKVDIFDADVGAGSNEAANGRDRARGSFNTTVQYRLYDPAGNPINTQFTQGDDNGPSNADNAWLNVYDSNSVGAKFESAASATRPSSNGSQLTIDRPSGTSAGDLLIAVISTDGQAGNLAPSSPANGWTAVASSAVYETGGGGHTSGVWWRRATNSEPANYTFNWGNNQQAVGVILRYSNVITSGDPIDKNNNISAAASDSGQTGGGNTENIDAPSVTTSQATTVLRIVGVDEDHTLTVPSGYTQRFNLASDNDGGSSVTLAVGDLYDASSGSTGTAAFTYSNNNEENPWVAFTLALIPADTSIAPMAGHWRLEVDSSEDNGNDIVAYGIRANDGDATSGGAELAIYAEPYLSLGVNDESGNPATDSYVLYPYLTSGCQVDSNQFDMDANASGDQGQIVVKTRQDAPILTIGDSSLSGEDVWNSVQSSDFDSSDFRNIDHGIGNAKYDITEYPGPNSNYTVWYLSDPDTTAIPPDSITEPGFRVYFPPDGAGDTTAPVKPYLEQELTYLSGPNPPQNGQTTTVQITVRLVNPTANQITFPTASDLVTVTVPNNGRVKYAGHSFVSTGSITAEPSVSGTGDITWDPGTVAADTTEIMTYWVEVTPQTNIEQIFVTGQPSSSNGTVATWLDETQNSSQGRATYTFGQLCGLSATEDTSITNNLLQFDFGDAPDSYGTKLQGGGSAARQWIPRDGSGNLVQQLSISGDPDAESDGQPGSAANLDSEEGGVAFRAPGATNHSIFADVPIINNTNGTVTVCAWLDVPAGGLVDGVFDASDGMCQSTSAPSPTLMFQWSNLPNDTSYTTYARFRVTSAPLTTSDPTGAAPDGEVEDYRVQFDFTPTVATIGKVSLEAAPTHELLSALSVGQMDTEALAALLASWDPEAAARLQGAGRDALLAALLAYADPDGDGQVAIFRWDTLEQRGTIGFYVERQVAGTDDWVRIDNDLLPAIINAPMGAQYRLLDPGARSGAVYQYRLIELEATGNTRSYGPYQVAMP